MSVLSKDIVEVLTKIIFSTYLDLNLILIGEFYNYFTLVYDVCFFIRRPIKWSMSKAVFQIFQPDNQAFFISNLLVWDISVCCNERKRDFDCFSPSIFDGRKATKNCFDSIKESCSRITRKRERGDWIHYSFWSVVECYQIDKQWKEAFIIGWKYINGIDLLSIFVILKINFYFRCERLTDKGLEDLAKAISSQSPHLRHLSLNFSW